MAVLTTLVKIPLSGSVNGAPIAMSTTSLASAVTIHTATSNTGTGQGDEVVIYVSNLSSNSIQLTLGIGGTGTANQQIFSVPASTTEMVMAGLILNNGLTVVGTGGTANLLNITGYVIRAS